MARPRKVNEVGEAAAMAPTGPGVYFFVGAGGQLLYVGKAADIRRRLRDHARNDNAALRRVRDVRWELCGGVDAALLREADLIVALAPALNRAIAAHDPDVYVRVRVGPGSRETVRFELTSTVSAAAGARVYGTFPHLAKGAASLPGKKTKQGFTAFLRLLWIAQRGTRAARVPPRLAGLSPPLSHECPATVELRAGLHEYLSGRSARVLGELATAIADADLPEFMRTRLQQDMAAAQVFFDFGPRRLRQLRLRHKLATGPVTGDTLAALLAVEIQDTIGEFRTRRWPPRAAAQVAQ